MKQLITYVIKVLNNFPTRKTVFPFNVSSSYASLWFHYIGNRKIQPVFYNILKIIFFSLAEISVVVCEDDQKCNLLLDRAPRCLKKLIVFKECRPATKQRAKNRGVEIVKFSDVEMTGSKVNHPEVVRNKLSHNIQSIMQESIKRFDNQL